MEWVECACGKRGYLSRKAASSCRGQLRNRARIYRCSVDKSLLHITNQAKASKVHDLEKGVRRYKRNNDSKKERRFKDRGFGESLPPPTSNKGSAPASLQHYASGKRAMDRRRAPSGCKTEKRNVQSFRATASAGDKDGDQERTRLCCRRAGQYCPCTTVCRYVLPVFFFILFPQKRRVTS